MSKIKPDTSEHLEEGSFLQSWSKRKARIAAEEQSISQQKIVADIQNAPEKPIEEPPKQELTDADMPAVDTLDEHSDYSVFFSPKVSEELRRLALRKLFHSPSYNITDGLDDYAGDYTQFAGLGDVITQDMRHIAETEARRALEAGTQAPGEKDIEDQALADDQTPKTPPESDEESLA